MTQRDAVRPNRAVTVPMYIKCKCMNAYFNIAVEIAVSPHAILKDCPA